MKEKQEVELSFSTWMGLTFLMLCGLKVSKAIDASWWLVCLPLYIQFLFGLTVLGGLAIWNLIDKAKEKGKKNVR